MIRHLATAMSFLIFTGIAGPAAVGANALQLSQAVADRESQGAAKNSEYDENRKLDDEAQEARDAKDRAKQGVILGQEAQERGERAAESEQNRLQRKDKLKALIDR